MSLGQSFALGTFSGKPQSLSLTFPHLADNTRCNRNIIKEEFGDKTRGVFDRRAVPTGSLTVYVVYSRSFTPYIGGCYLSNSKRTDKIGYFKYATVEDDPSIYHFTNKKLAPVVLYYRTKTNQFIPLDDNKTLLDYGIMDPYVTLYAQFVQPVIMAKL